MLYCQCNSVILLVQQCCTVGTRALHFSGTDCFTGKYKLFDGKLCRLVFHI